MKIYIQTNKATTNIFGLHTQPRKTTRYTNILKVVCGGGEKEKEPEFFLGGWVVFLKIVKILPTLRQFIEVKSIKHHNKW